MVDEGIVTGLDFVVVLVVLVEPRVVVEGLFCNKMIII